MPWVWFDDAGWASKTPGTILEITSHDPDGVNKTEAQVIQTMPEEQYLHLQDEMAHQAAKEENKRNWEQSQ